MNRIIILCALILMLELTACSQITQEVAEAKAIRFVKERVKFYTKDNSSGLDFPAYSFHSVNSYKEGNRWVINIQITSTKNESRKTDVVVELNARNGDITKFNNQPVSYQ